MFFVSCKEDKKQNNGPIILGDPATIVTETDSKYMSDFVDDIQLLAPQSNSADTDTQSIAKTDTSTGNAASQPES